MAPIRACVPMCACYLYVEQISKLCFLTVWVTSVAVLTGDSVGPVHFEVFIICIVMIAHRSTWPNFVLHLSLRRQFMVTFAHAADIFTWTCIYLNLDSKLPDYQCTIVHFFWMIEFHEYVTKQHHGVNHARCWTSMHLGLIFHLLNWSILMCSNCWTCAILAP